MVKISVSELEQLLKLIKASSHDMHLIAKEEHGTLQFQFQNIEGQMSSATLYDESTKLYAKLQSSEALSVALNRLKGAK